MYLMIFACRAASIFSHCFLYEVAKYGPLSRTQSFLLESKSSKMLIDRITPIFGVTAVLHELYIESSFNFYTGLATR